MSDMAMQPSPTMETAGPPRPNCVVFTICCSPGSIKSMIAGAYRTTSERIETNRIFSHCRLDCADFIPTILKSYIELSMDTPAPDPNDGRLCRPTTSPLNPQSFTHYPSTCNKGETPFRRLSQRPRTGEESTTGGIDGTQVPGKKEECHCKIRRVTDVSHVGRPSCFQSNRRKRRR